MNKIEKLLISIIGLFLIVSRFILPELITPSLTHDEIIYAANAKSLSLSGTDLSKSQGLFSLNPFHHMYAEFPASFMTIGFQLFKNPILATHFLPSIFSILLPFLIAWLMWGIFKQKKVAFAALFVSAVSPLLWQFARLSYDSFFSLFFYIAGSAVYINTKSKSTLWSLPLFFLGFFNYQGFKLLLLPLAIFLCISKYKIFSTKKLKAIPLKKYSLPLLAAALTLLYGLVLLPSQQTSIRLKQTIITDSAKSDHITQGRRKNSLAPAIGKYFSNTPISILELGTENLLNALSPAMIFFRGEPGTSGFSAWSHGYFYLFEIILLILGAYFMLNSIKDGRQGKAMLFLLIASLLPSFISSLSQWYLLRSLMLYVTFIFFISYGISRVWGKNIFKYLIVFTYSVSILNFTYQYYFQYPIYRSDASELHERIAIEYASRIKDHTVYIYDDEPHYLFQEDLIYKNILTKENISTYQAAFVQENYTIKNRIYTNKCHQLSDTDVLIYSTLYYPCSTEPPLSPITIPSVLDGGGKYRIVGDPLCNSYELQRYVRISSHQNFAFDTLSDQQFCQIWIASQK